MIRARLAAAFEREDYLSHVKETPERSENAEAGSDPAVLAAEIVEDVQAALDQFALIAADLAKNDLGAPASAIADELQEG